MARMVATKAALSIRVDALTDVEGKSEPTAPTIGLENRAKLESRLRALEHQNDLGGIRSFVDPSSSKKQKKFEMKADVKTYNTAADAVDLLPTQRDVTMSPAERAVKATLEVMEEKKRAKEEKKKRKEKHKDDMEIDSTPKPETNGKDEESPEAKAERKRLKKEAKTAKKAEKEKEKDQIEEKEKKKEKKKDKEPEVNGSSPEKDKKKKRKREEEETPAEERSKEKKKKKHKD